MAGLRGEQSRKGVMNNSYGEKKGYSGMRMVMMTIIRITVVLVMSVVMILVIAIMILTAITMIMMND